MPRRAPKPPPRSRTNPAELFALLGGFDYPREELEDDLVALGKKAVPLLTKKLADDEQGWAAARILSRIGLPAARSAVPTLERQLRQAKTEPGRAWPARALAKLGRLDLLEPLLTSTRKEDLITLVEGLEHGRPESYGFLERATSTGSTALKRLITERLSPGSASFEFTLAQLPLVEGALRSKHAVLRRDAVCNLTEIETSSRKHVAPLLLAALKDEDGDVRRLAAWGFQWLGKRFVRAAVAELALLKRDPVEAVREAARSSLEKVGA